MARNPPAIPIVIGRFAGHVARKPPDYYSNNRGGGLATWPANLPITIVITGPAHYAKRHC